MRPARLALAGALLLAAAAPAQELWVPAAAHADGVGDTVWRTDLELKARGAEPATVRVDLLREGLDNSVPLSATVTVPSGTCLRLPDLLGATFGVAGNGALRLSPSSGAILATSRTYNDDPDGTYGQLVPALPLESAAEAGTDHALIQLGRSASPGVGYRTNLGLVNAGATAIALEVELRTAAGSPLGERSFALPPFGYEQVSDVFALVTADDVADGYALVRSRTAGGRFFAWASVVDNRSGDAVFIPAQEDGPSPPPPRLVVFEAFLRHG